MMAWHGNACPTARLNRCAPPADQDDVVEGVRVVDVLHHQTHSLLRDFPHRLVEPLDVVGLSKYLGVLACAQGKIDRVDVTVVRAGGSPLEPADCQTPPMLYDRAPSTLETGQPCWYCEHYGEWRKSHVRLGCGR
jgi:hypothetical protein